MKLSLIYIQYRFNSIMNTAYGIFNTGVQSLCVSGFVLGPACILCLPAQHEEIPCSFSYAPAVLPLFFHMPHCHHFQISIHTSVYQEHTSESTTHLHLLTSKMKLVSLHGTFQFLCIMFQNQCLPSLLNFKSSKGRNYSILLSMYP